MQRAAAGAERRLAARHATERIALVTLLDAFGANLEEVLAEYSDPRGSLDRRDDLNEMRDG